MAKTRKNKIRTEKRNYSLRYLAFIILVIVILEISLVVLEKKTENKEERAINSSSIELYLPAVDASKKGVSTLLKVDVINGTGRTLVEINGLLFWADTQQSIRMAKLVAENITGIKADNYDFVYSIEANASVIGGPSAGAALAIATIAALEGKKPKNNIMITGTINHDGSIGPVSEIYAKAQAAKAQNMKLFLVPLLQASDVVYETNQHCEKFGSTEICQSETTPKKINVTKEAGIQVKEVENIREAMNYFFN